MQVSKVLVKPHGLFIPHSPELYAPLHTRVEDIFQRFIEYWNALGGSSMLTRTAYEDWRGKTKWESDAKQGNNIGRRSRKKEDIRYRRKMTWENRGM